MFEAGLWCVPVLCRSMSYCCVQWILSSIVITKTRLFKYIEKFTIKNLKFSDKNSDVFHISAQNIDYGYSLEPPRRGGSNEYLGPINIDGSERVPITYVF